MAEVTNDYSATGAPKFVMVGAQLAPDRCRLYASRDLPPGSAAWGQRLSKQYGPAEWHIETDLPYCLIVEYPTWGQCFGRVFEIWENHDRNKQAELAQEQKRKALAQRRALGKAAGKTSPGNESAQVTQGELLDRHPVTMARPSDSLVSDLGGEP